MKASVIVPVGARSSSIPLAETTSARSSRRRRAAAGRAGPARRRRRARRGRGPTRRARAPGAGAGRRGRRRGPSPGRRASSRRPMRRAARRSARDGRSRRARPARRPRPRRPTGRRARRRRRARARRAAQGAGEVARALGVRAPPARDRMRGEREVAHEQEAGAGRHRAAGRPGADAGDDQHGAADVDDLERRALHRIGGVAAVGGVEQHRPQRAHACTHRRLAGAGAAAAARIAPSGAPSGSVASTTIAAAASGAPIRSTRVWPRRSTTRASAGFDTPGRWRRRPTRGRPWRRSPVSCWVCRTSSRPSAPMGSRATHEARKRLRAPGARRTSRMPARVPTAGGRAKRFGSGRIHRQGQRAGLEVEQGALVLEAAAEAGQRPVAADDAVARADDGDRVAAVGAADGARLARVADPRGDLAVAGGLAVGDLQERGPDAPLEGAAAVGSQLEVEVGAPAGEVLGQLGDDRSKRASSETSPAPKPMRVSAPSSSTVRASGPTGEAMVVCMVI